ncbi:hypothetical protein [Rhodopirellula sp. SWK7]|uniref:hypothetical protein n=1 Tax=Rhodopirellula sp. SWK7 TaxID=595460 RepID=UPI0002BDFFFF|nr:hypothetical protein [Rhodopirellula sp. SWK7]EMI45421.1 hypothetical protein RRSWK_01825 [Rhodopirellula sp. SWK7]
MQRFTAQIALIAYVVGGWLLPAAHHHVHDHSAGGVVCECAVVAIPPAAPPTPAPHTPGSHDTGCCCDHSAEHPSADDHPESHSSLVAGQSNADECVGLCALCCSISLVGQVGDSLAISFAPFASDDESRLKGLTFPLPPLCGGISSRGPPTV